MTKKFYVNVGKTLADGIELSNKSFESYLKENEHEMTEYELTHEELDNAFKFLESNKGEGLDEIHVNIVKSVFDLIRDPLHFIFNLSLKQGIFPNELKPARVIPVFKSGDDSLVSNYRPISILPCFSKLLE